jgi:predicted acylesterase/phospholipase RssA
MLSVSWFVVLSACAVSGLSQTRRGRLRPYAPLLLLGILVAGCTGTPRNAVPEHLVSMAAVPSLKDIRYWGDEPPANMADRVREILRQRRAAGERSYQRGGSPRINILVLSGGADNGAYGAGLLNGWSDAGSRPQFDIVTGVSTGALIAPFAFLGPRYDTALKSVYTSYDADDYFVARPLKGLLGGTSLADVAPLYSLIATYADDALIDNVAREHQKGRRLFVQTTNLDAQRPVIWDMGAIAAHRSTLARELFRRVLLASASVPAIFPPVRIKVHADGRSFEEMHVDGGVVSQQAGLSAWIFQTHDFVKAAGIRPARTIYIIRNNTVSPEWQSVDNNVLKIAARASSTTIKYQGNADLYMDYLAARERGAQFRATAIGDDFAVKYVGPFDRGYMNRLFRYGYAKGRNGNPWQTSPTHLLQTARAAP